MSESLHCTPPTHRRPAMRLSELRDGQRARLHSTNLCCEDCEMLNAMGLTDQCEIRVCQRASPGKPCIVQVHATRLGLCASLAENIFVSTEKA